MLFFKKTLLRFLLFVSLACQSRELVELFLQVEIWKCSMMAEQQVMDLFEKSKYHLNRAFNWVLKLLVLLFAGDSCLEVVYRMYWLCYHIHTYKKTHVILEPTCTSHHLFGLISGCISWSVDVIGVSCPRNFNGWRSIADGPDEVLSCHRENSEYLML